MYEAYWKLESKPFENRADSAFFFPSSEHHATLLKLRYSVESGHAAALLTGPTGVGKTLLLHCLAQQLSDSRTPVVHVVFPQMAPEQLLAYLTDKLAGPSEGEIQPCRSVQRLESFLEENSARGSHAVLLIDEAHLLQDAASLEVIRLLTNFQFDGRPALSIVLAGLPSILTTLERMPELDERLSVKSLLPSLTADETRQYVEHCLEVAGVATPVFEPEAMAALHSWSHGAPRRINRLADLALLIGYAEERVTIGAAQIEAVAEELTPLVSG